MSDTVDETTFDGEFGIDLDEFDDPTPEIGDSGGDVVPEPVTDTVRTTNPTTNTTVMSRAKVRRIVAKTVEVAAADTTVRAVLARLLSVEDDTVALTTAVFTADRSALADLELLAASMDADPIGLGAMLMHLASDNRSGLKSLWDLAAVFGADLPVKVPSQAMKSVEVLARAIQGMPSTTANQIAVARALAKRG